MEAKGRLVSRIAALIFLAAAAIGCDSGEASTLESPPGEAEARERVRAGDFVRQSIESRLGVAADLEAVEEADVYPEIAGIVEELLAREGDRVTASQPIIRLVDAEFALIVETKRILAEQAKTRAEQAALAVRETRSQLEQKRLLAEEAAASYKRSEELAAGEFGTVSAEELETKRYQRDRTRIDLDACLLQIEKAELEKAQAEQNSRLADVELRTAELNLSRTVLRSPIAGHISHLDLHPGERVATANLVFSVVRPDRLRARLYPPQKEIRRLHVGQSVRVTTDIYPDEEFHGDVSVISPIIDRENGTVGIIVDVRDPKDLLKPGMFVSGEIVLDVHEDALLVPKKAVVYENQEPVVYLVEGDIARRYVVRSGYTNKDHIEVLELIDMDGRRHATPAGKLVMVGQNRLKDRSPVEVEPASGGVAVGLGNRAAGR